MSDDPHYDPEESKIEHEENDPPRGNVDYEAPPDPVQPKNGEEHPN